MRLIDADALKFHERVKPLGNGQYEYVEVVYKDDIDKQPTIEPMRKKGKWITVNDAYNRISGKCSACGWEAHMYEDDVVGMEYCPNCGAKMKEGEAE